MQRKAEEDVLPLVTVQLIGNQRAFGELISVFPSRDSSKFCLKKANIWQIDVLVVQPVWSESLAGFHTPGAAPASVAQRPAPRNEAVGSIGR
jgi:hypothetical protein